MVFPTPQIYTYHIFQHSFFLSQQLNINKIRHSESFAQLIIYQIIAPLLCCKTHLTMLSFSSTSRFSAIFRVFSSSTSLWNPQKPACTNFRLLRQRLLKAKLSALNFVFTSACTNFTY